MLLARYALADTQKWKAPGYRRPGVPREEYRSIGIGFSEHFGFEVMSARGGNPNYINSEIALSLAWIGSYPCFYAMLPAGNGEEFWRFFEYTYVEQKLDNWRKRHPGHRNWHDANIAPHLYLRLLLGEKPETVRRELEAQKMLAPDPRMAAENAGFYALYFGGASPVRLSDQGPGKAAPVRLGRSGRNGGSGIRIGGTVHARLRADGETAQRPRERTGSAARPPYAPLDVLTAGRISRTRFRVPRRRVLRFCFPEYSEGYTGSENRLPDHRQTMA